MLPSPSLGPPLLSASWSPPLPWGMAELSGVGVAAFVSRGAGFGSGLTALGLGVTALGLGVTAAALGVTVLTSGVPGLALDCAGGAFACVARVDVVRAGV